MTNDFTSEDLERLLDQFRRETGCEPRPWRIVYHINGPGGKSSGALTLLIPWRKDGRSDYWSKTIREADHEGAKP